MNFYASDELNLSNRSGGFFASGESQESARNNNSNSSNNRNKNKFQTPNKSDK